MLLPVRVPDRVLHRGAYYYIILNHKVKEDSCHRLGMERVEVVPRRRCPVLHMPLLAPLEGTIIHKEELDFRLVRHLQCCYSLEKVDETGNENEGWIGENERGNGNELAHL